MSSTDKSAAITYDEPSIATILALSSFLILLNVLNWALDRLIYCGLVGQMLIGVAWGTPGWKLLSTDTENTIVQLGYIGLILLIFEGGLSASIPSLKANIARSACVAMTGILLPIALSFIMAPLADATHLQCFAAGAALCSTSLGTTITVLRTCGMDSTRLGVVLTSAALLDDIVGLVMVQVIANLGSTGDGSASSPSVAAIVRPVLVSIAFVFISALACRVVVQPVRNCLIKSGVADPSTRLGMTIYCRQTTLVVCSALLISLVTAASYAGTSNLLAAYIAGAVISWWDTINVHITAAEAKATRVATTGLSVLQATEDARPSTWPFSESCQIADVAPALAIQVPNKNLKAESTHDYCLRSQVVHYYYHPAIKLILRPFFFASIGFSIPITRMFSGPIIWRGIVYAALMGVAKLLCGIWLLPVPFLRNEIKSSNETKPTTRARSPTTQIQWSSPFRVNIGSGAPQTQPETPSIIPSQRPSGQHSPYSDPSNTTPNPLAPLSIYPAAILGLSMVPRGEIGFIISSVAQRQGIFAAGSAEPDVFLIVTWAIVLCTVVGPLSVGLLARRLKGLSTGKGKDASSRDALGVWGV